MNTPQRPDYFDWWPVVVLLPLTGPTRVVLRDPLVQIGLQFADAAVELAPQQFLQQVLDGAVADADPEFPPHTGQDSTRTRCRVL